MVPLNVSFGASQCSFRWSVTGIVSLSISFRGSQCSFKRLAIGTVLLTVSFGGSQCSFRRSAIGTVSLSISFRGSVFVQTISNWYCLVNCFIWGFRTQSLYRYYWFIAASLLSHMISCGFSLVVSCEGSAFASIFNFIIPANWKCSVISAKHKRMYCI